MRRAVSKQDATAMFMAWAVTVKCLLSESEPLLNCSWSYAAPCPMPQADAGISKMGRVLLDSEGLIYSSFCTSGNPYYKVLMTGNFDHSIAFQNLFSIEDLKKCLIILFGPDPLLHNREHYTHVSVCLYKDLPERCRVSGHRLRLEWHHAVYSRLRVQGSRSLSLATDFVFRSQWASGVNRSYYIWIIYILNKHHMWEHLG